MSIFKKLGLVTDDAPAVAPEDETPVVSSPRRVMRPTVAASVAPFAGMNVPGFGPAGAAPDAGIVQTLNDAAATSSKAGYEQFLVNLDALKGLPDVQRYAMALNLTQANHKLKPEAILASLDDRVRLVDVEAGHFNDAMTEAVTSQVTARQTSAAKLDEEIAKLAATMQEKAAQRDALVQEAAAAEADIAVQRATFDASINVVMTALSSEREKIAGIISSTQAPAK